MRSPIARLSCWIAEVSWPGLRSLPTSCALRVALRFQLLGLGQRRAALGIQRAKLLDIELIPARRQTLGDGVQIGPEEGKIMHVRYLSSLTVAVSDTEPRASA